MNNKDEEISEGLNQIFELINAKGDIGELKKIMNQTPVEDDSNQD